MVISSGPVSFVPSFVPPMGGSAMGGGLHRPSCSRPRSGRSGQPGRLTPLAPAHTSTDQPSPFPFLSDCPAPSGWIGSTQSHLATRWQGTGAPLPRAQGCEERERRGLANRRRLPGRRVRDQRTVLVVFVSREVRGVVLPSVIREPLYPPNGGSGPSTCGVACLRCQTGRKPPAGRGDGRRRCPLRDPRVPPLASKMPSVRKRTTRIRACFQAPAISLLPWRNRSSSSRWPPPIGSRYSPCRRTHP